MRYRERCSATRSVGRNLAKTAAQIVVFWGFFLWVLPELIVRVGAALVLEIPFAFAGQAPLAAIVFGSASSLGLWSAWVVVTRGAGTPLPLDATNALVTSGPYAFVRNPMAIAGLTQGAAVGLHRGSTLVLVYVVIGTVLWQCIARPREEQELARRFGEAYRDYCAGVRCWWPRFRRRRASFGHNHTA